MLSDDDILPMADKFISFSCIVEAVASRRDKTIKITLGTQELPPSEAGVLLALANQHSFAYLSPNALKEEELVVPEASTEFKTERTPSEQLRAILYRVWEQNTDKKQAFPDWYKSYMFKLCQQLKEKLN